MKKKVQMAAPEEDKEDDFENLKDGAPELKDRTGTMAGPPLAD